MRNNKRRDVVLGLHFINRSNMTNKTTTNYLLNHTHTRERKRETKRQYIRLLEVGAENSSKSLSRNSGSVATIAINSGLCKSLLEISQFPQR